MNKNSLPDYNLIHPLIITWVKSQNTSHNYVVDMVSKIYAKHIFHLFEMSLLIYWASICSNFKANYCQNEDRES